MTSTELQHLIDQNEGQHIEFKLESEKQADLAEVLMAFANDDGGHLFVGVADDGQIIGVENVKAVVDRLHSAARRLEPSLHAAVLVETIQIDNKIIVSAEVPQGLSATYSLAGQFRIREGSFNRQMTSADVVSHAVRRGTLDYELTPVVQATLNDLNEKKIKSFLAKRLRTNTPERPLDQLLQDINAISLDSNATWRPTVAGLLLFGNWPQFQLNHATILAARVVGPLGVQIIDRETIEGTLPEMIDQALLFVRRNTRHGLLIGKSATGQAIEVAEYPDDAVREAIINACCHRDYQERTPIQLKIYDDRLVVGNPGGLLPGLDVAHLVGKHKARNPQLANWLQALGYVERFGIGILRMGEAMKEAGLPMPIFQNRPDWFEVTLPGHGESFMRKPATNQAERSANQSPTSETSNESTTLQPWYRQTWSFGNAS